MSKKAEFELPNTISMLFTVQQEGRNDSKCAALFYLLNNLSLCTVALMRLDF